MQQVFTIFGATVTHIQIVTVVDWLLFVVDYSRAVVAVYSMFGKAVRAVSDDEEVSKIVGINTARVVGVVFFIASVIAGLAGVLVGFDTAIEPTMGMALLLKGIIAAIVGGIGSVYGAVLGAFLLGFAENFGIWKISGEWKDAIAFGFTDYISSFSSPWDTEVQNRNMQETSLLFHASFDYHFPVRYFGTGS